MGILCGISALMAGHWEIILVMAGLIFVIGILGMVISARNLR